MLSSKDERGGIAARFLQARRMAKGLPSYPGEMPSSLEHAYAIQEQAIVQWGEPLIGWKVGRVPEALVPTFGIDRLAGPIFSRTLAVYGETPEMPVFAEGFAAAEAEYLLRIGRSPPADQQKFSLDEVASLIDRVHVGIEIASSPLKTINELGPLAIISDFGNNNGLVIGPEIPSWQDSDFEQWAVLTFLDGQEAGSGCARSFPDGAVGSARFLFESMARRGIRLEPGQWISSGAVTGVHDARPGQRAEASFGDRFSVSCLLSAAMPQTSDTTQSFAN